MKISKNFLAAVFVSIATCVCFNVIDKDSIIVFNNSDSTLFYQILFLIRGLTATLILMTERIYIRDIIYGFIAADIFIGICTSFINYLTFPGIIFVFQISLITIYFIHSAISLAEENRQASENNLNDI